VVDAAAPDVLAVQEVGEPEALADLVARLEGDWQVVTSTVFEPGHPIRVGVLSREPIVEVAQVSEFPERLRPVQADDAGATLHAMPRGALRVRTAGFDLVVCHLKSKLLTFPGGRFSPRDEGERARYAAYALQRRGAEAATVRAAADGLLDGAGTERAVVVLGDLNDEPQAATTQILLGPPGSELGTGGYDRPDRGDARRLWNLAPLIPADRRYTRVFAGRRELIDHILVSRFLVTRAAVVDTAGVRPASIGPEPPARSDAEASDHAPVFARFDL
jgi:endonuclease/exonuclease/phosphatase family metal-dependent hydrolase